MFFLLRNISNHQSIAYLYLDHVLLPLPPCWELAEGAEWGNDTYVVSNGGLALSKQT